MSKELRKERLTKLYSLGTQVFSEDDIDIDLVQGLRKSKNPEEVLAKLGEVDRYLLIQTINELSEMDLQAIENRRFSVGGIDPRTLIGVTDQVEYFRILLKGYSDPEDFSRRFRHPIDVEETVGKNDIKAVLAGMLGSFAVETDSETRSQLLNLLAKDFANIGEQISYGRLNLLNRYLPDLMRVEAMKRWDCLGAILERRFPFSDDNRYNPEREDNWASEIRTLSS